MHIKQVWLSNMCITLQLHVHYMYTTCTKMNVTNRPVRYFACIGSGKLRGLRLHHLHYINKIQQDATVCRYLFTAKWLYMFRVSIAPIIRSTSNCNCSFWYRSLYLCNNLRPAWPLGYAGGRLLLWYFDLYQNLQLQFYVLLMTGSIDTRNM